MHSEPLKLCSAVLVATGLVLASATARAEVTSGPQPGERVGAFQVTKVAGNPDDGVDDGKHLCYRCRTGNKPVVMVFARTGDAALAKLVKKIEEEVEEHQAEKLTSFVNMIGTDGESLKKAAAEFVKANGIERVAFVVPDDAENGPPNLSIAPEADLTVVCYKEGKVVANHAFPKDGLTDDKIDAIVEASCSLVE
jgi:hypothetical protein